MPKNTFLAITVFLYSTLLFSQEKYTVSGIVADANNKETLIGVSLYIDETKTGISTNEYGFYSITLPKGDYTIILNYVGYQNIQEKFSLTQDTKKNFLL